MTRRAPPAEEPVRVARARYYLENGFPSDGGYTADCVRYPVLGMHLTLPNVAARRRALPLHDLHHLATGYDTTWAGETAIGAWELGSGCGQYGAAWFLSLVAFSVGVFMAPVRTWRAFRRGRGSDTLYRHSWDEAWLDLTVAALARRLRVNESRRTGQVGDAARFAGWSLPVVLGVSGLALLLARLARTVS